MTFNEIKKEEAKQLMNLFSFFAPNNIHCSWFSEASEQLAKYPLLQKKIKNENEYRAILKELEEHSLIKLKDDVISIDPSTQEAVRNEIAEKYEYVNTCINIMKALIFYDFSTRESKENFSDMEKSIKSILAYNKEETPEVANLYFFLGFGFNELADYSQALEYNEKALKFNEIVFIKDPKNKASIYNNIAWIYKNKENYDLALKFYEKALNIREKEFGTEHQYTATTYNGIAGVYNNKKNYDLALKFYEKALNIREKEFGTEHQYTATTYNGIAGVYNNKKNYRLALKFYEKTLKIREKKLGTKHQYTATTYNGIAKVYENKSKFSEAVEYYIKAGIKNILEMLVCFKEENREEVIKQGLLNNLLKNDPYFQSVINNVKDKKIYESLYIQSIYIISLLHINDSSEKEVAYYTQKNLAEKMLFNKNNTISKFRLNSINFSNDPEEGLVLLEYLFEGKTVNNEEINPYRAFASCFTFNHDSLNQFRLYGKEEDKECTGVSIVFKKSFFEESAQLATQQLKDDNMKASMKEEGKYALFRCIYIDPNSKTDKKIVSVGHKEDFLFHRDGKTEEIINIYNDKIKKLIEKVSKKLTDLKNHIEDNKLELDKDIIFQLLINLRYLTKHVAFKEEQECRIIKIEKLENENVKMDESERMHLEYLEISEYVEKIYFAPNASGMNIFQDKLLNERKEIKCIKSKNPFAL